MHVPVSQGPQSQLVGVQELSPVKHVTLKHTRRWHELPTFRLVHFGFSSVFSDLCSDSYPAYATNPIHATANSSDVVTMFLFISESPPGIRDGSA